MHDSTVLASPSRAATRAVTLALAAWLLAVVAIAALGMITIERRAIVPLGIVGQTLVLVAIYRRKGALFELAHAIDVRIPILFHSVRAPIGVGFLVLAARSQLDPLFARIAGWGDLAVGVLAVVVALGGPTARRRRVRALWNAFGLVDILVVVATAQYVLFVSGHPQTMAGLLAFPWPLVPLVAVPLVLATHALLVVRLSRA